MRNVLMCYRGRYREQVASLVGRLRTLGLSVTYDHEILSTPGESEPTEVEWISLDDRGSGGVTTWRAPLKQAIALSELTVFLVDPQDQSENVINEISWVAKAGTNAFFVLDTRSASVTPEAEGFYVSFLNITYALALRRWEVPGFEHLLFAHEDPSQLDARLDVLVNRIAEYLERVRHHPLPVVRFENNLTVDDIGKFPMARGRTRLAAIQEAIHKRFLIKPPPHAGDPYREALDYAFELERGGVIEGDLIRLAGSPFRYELISERKRFLRTQRIVERTRPGRYEQHPLFTLLARQAASIELLLEEAAGGKGFTPPLLLGTLPVSAVDDVATVAVDPEYAIVFLDAAFVDFVYQIAKVSVCSWKLTSPPNRVPATFSAELSDVAETIQANAALEDGFFDCVSSYAVSGLPASSVGQLPTSVHQAPLSLLIGTAERFMVGRGYAQLALMDPRFPSLTAAGSGNAPAQERDRVLAIDRLSTDYVLASSMFLDRIDPAMALQGCGIAVICADLIHRAAAALDPGTPAVSSHTSPPLRDRLATLESAYLAVAEGQGASREWALGGLRPAHLAWQTPELLWSRVQGRLTEARERGARPAWMWR